MFHALHPDHDLADVRRRQDRQRGEAATTRARRAARQLDRHRFRARGVHRSR